MSVLNLNKVLLCGRLTADVELKQTPNGVMICSFTLAVNRKLQPRSTDAEQAQQADFITCVAWRQTAEFISKYFRKGSAICVTGSIQTRSWQDRDGYRRYATEVVINEANFVDSNMASPKPVGEAESPAGVNYASNTPMSAPHFEDIGTEDDLPF